MLLGELRDAFALNVRISCARKDEMHERDSSISNKKSQLLELQKQFQQLEKKRDEMQR